MSVLRSKIMGKMIKNQELGLKPGMNLNLKRNKKNIRHRRDSQKSRCKEETDTSDSSDDEEEKREKGRKKGKLQETFLLTNQRESKVMKEKDKKEQRQREKDEGGKEGGRE